MTDAPFLQHDAPTGRMSQDVKFVDMERSVIDDKKSDMENGRYFFKRKVYFDRDGTEGRTPTQAGFVVKWNRNKPREIEQWQTRFQAQCIDKEIGRNVIYPEPLRLNSEGYYTYGDGIAVIIPVDIWLSHRKRADDKSKAAVKQRVGGFKKFVQREVNRELQGEDAGGDVMEGSHVGGKPLK